jgi:hypothetical protein
VTRPTRSNLDGAVYLDLQRKARVEGRATDELLALYALEGFLDRLNSSPRAPDLVLKGGVLLAAYDTRRPTRDIDLQVTETELATAAAAALVRDIAAIHREDGLVYDLDSVTAEVIRDQHENAGVRISLTCHLSRARIPFHVDINVGDPIWPRPTLVEVPRLLSGSIAVLGYPLPMMLAEKIVTAVQRGTVNTRWRDYADISLLSATQDVDGDELAHAIGVGAHHRNADLIPLSEVLTGYAEIAQDRWRAWVRKQRLDDRLPEHFAMVLHDVMTFAEPAVNGTITGQTWAHKDRRWMPG